MIAEGMLILVIGMGTVFAFFGLLVLTMNLLGALVAAFNKRFPEAIPAPLAAAPTTVRNESDAQVALAIAAAKRFIQ